MTLPGIVTTRIECVLPGRACERLTMKRVKSGESAEEYDESFIFDVNARYIPNDSAVLCRTLSVQDHHLTPDRLNA
jgi:hypothetical protein